MVVCTASFAIFIVSVGFDRHPSGHGAKTWTTAGPSTSSALRTFGDIVVWEAYGGCCCIFNLVGHTDANQVFLDALAFQGLLFLLGWLL